MADVPAHMAGLSDLQRAFVEHVARGVGVGEAALAAGYAHKESGYAVIKQTHIRKALDTEFESVRLSSGPEAWNELHRLLKSKKDDVRLRAASAILDRVGVVAGRSLDVRHTHQLSDLSNEQLHERLRLLVASMSPGERQQLQAAGITLAALPPPAEPAIDATYTEVKPTETIADAAPAVDFEFLRDMNDGDDDE